MILFVTFCSIMCFFMILPSLIWPQHFSPTGEGFAQFREAGAVLWACCGIVFLCWSGLLRLHAACGWCTMTIVLLPAAIILTLSTLILFWFFQR